MTQITAGKDTSTYRLILARGECRRPPTEGIELAAGKGELLKDHGTGAHVDIPVSSLTGGAYVVSVETQKRVIVACGVIRRTGWM
ncbi:MAG: hypothetical protein ABI231_10065 [Candidatus Tumulicola sp.]